MYLKIFESNTIHKSGGGLDSSIETVFLMASENQQFISSRLVKEIFTFGGDISSFVSSNVLKEMQIQKLNNK